MPSSANSARPLVALAGLALALAYPFIVYLGLGAMPPEALLAVLAALLLARLLAGRRLAGGDPFLFATLAALVGVLALAPFGGEMALRAYPVLLSLGLGLVFAWSLHRPVSAIERLARLSEPDLPKAAVGYTRRVTLAWTVFFLGNATIAGFIGWRGSLEAWTIYNGLISYLLAGTLMAVEYLLRRRFRRRLAAGA